MSERLETVFRRLQRWCIHKVWWLCLLLVGFDVLSLIYRVSENRDFGWRVFSLLFHLAGAVYFWLISRRVKKLEATHHPKLEGGGETPQS